MPAVKSGDPNKIADAVQSLAGDNKGVNHSRRMQEAAYIRQQIPTAGSPSNLASPSLANMSGSPIGPSASNNVGTGIPPQLLNAGQNPANVYNSMQTNSLTPEQHQEIIKSLDKGNDDYSSNNLINLDPNQFNQQA
jgi:hypothetical protein